MSSEITYKKIEIDNAVCRRRFHIAFEDATPLEGHVKLECPHCHLTIYEKKDHPRAELIREENLTHQPDGSRPILTKCQFNPNKS